MEYDKSALEIRPANIDMYALITLNNDIYKYFLRAMAEKGIANPCEKDVESWLTDIEYKLYN